MGFEDGTLSGGAPMQKKPPRYSFASQGGKKVDRSYESVQLRNDNMQLQMNQSYRVIAQTDRYFGTLYNIFYTLTIVLLILQALSLIVMLSVPWPLVANFLTRSRAYDLDLTIIFFWVQKRSFFLFRNSRFLFFHRSVVLVK